jgi:hypothetical protein
MSLIRPIVVHLAWILLGVVSTWLAAEGLAWLAGIDANLGLYLIATKSVSCSLGLQWCARRAIVDRRLWRAAPLIIVASFVAAWIMVLHAGGLAKDYAPIAPEVIRFAVSHGFVEGWGAGYSLLSRVTGWHYETCVLGGLVTHALAIQAVGVSLLLHGMPTDELQKAIPAGPLPRSSSYSTATATDPPTTTPQARPTCATWSSPSVAKPLPCDRCLATQFEPLLGYELRATVRLFDRQSPTLCGRDRNFENPRPLTCPSQPALLAVHACREEFFRTVPPYQARGPPRKDNQDVKGNVDGLTCLAMLSSWPWATGPGEYC